MKLTEAREDRGLTMTALAKKCGVSLTVIHRIEKGKASTSHETVSKIAGALDVTLEDIEELKAAIEWDGKLGDPCECRAKCGGVKVLPENPRSRKFDIRLPVEVAAPTGYTSPMRFITPIANVAMVAFSNHCRSIPLSNSKTIHG